MKLIVSGVIAALSLSIIGGASADPYTLVSNITEPSIGYVVVASYQQAASQFSVGSEDVKLSSITLNMAQSDDPGPGPIYYTHIQVP